MNEIQKYTALKLPWVQVAKYVSSLVSAVLEREITCEARREDDEYWSVAAENDCFTNVEVVRRGKVRRAKLYYPCGL